jgi:hypothetical protein
MTRKVSIWELARYESNTRLDYYGTKREAETEKQSWEATKEGDWHATIHEISFPATRHGIAAAMNHVITITCHNEH